MKSVYNRFVSAGDVILDVTLSGLGSVTAQNAFHSNIGVLLAAVAIAIGLGSLFVQGNYLVFLTILSALILTILCVGVSVYVDRQQSRDVRWKATISWICFLIAAMIGILISFYGTYIFSNPLFCVFGIALVVGIVGGIGILCCVPGRGVLVWLGFLIGVAPDSINAFGIFRWLNQIATNAADSMINPFLPDSAQLSSGDINLGVMWCLVCLIALSIPAFWDS